MNKQKRLPRRVFTAEYKAEAVKLVIEQQIPQAEMARQLDRSIKSTTQWVKNTVSAHSKAVRAQINSRQIKHCIRELGVELAVAKIERDILKKVTAHC